MITSSHGHQYCHVELAVTTSDVLSVQDKLSFCDYLATEESEPEANARLQAVLGVGAGQVS